MAGYAATAGQSAEDIRLVLVPMAAGRPENSRDRLRNSIVAEGTKLKSVE